MLGGSEAMKDLHAAAALFGFTGEVVTGVRLLGMDLTAVVRIDIAEVQRRDQVGLGAVVDHDLTEALAELPVDWPVPRTELDPVTVARLKVAPPGVVEETTTALVRQWRPALTLSGVFIVVRRAWRAGLQKVSLFAPDAPRGLVVCNPPQNMEPVLALAKELGIGLIAPNGHGWRLVLEPDRQPSYAPGPRHWRLLESVYRTWRLSLLERSSAQLFR